MTTDELIARTREFEAEIRKSKTSMTRFQKEVKDLDLHIKDNKEKLNMST